MTYLSSMLPKDRESWKKYSKIFWPIIISSMLFTADGLVGNFMVGHITEGTASLAAINSWNNILVGFFVASAATGSVVMAQHYFSGDFKIVKEIARIRYIITISVATIFIAIAWINPDLLINVFLKGNIHDAAYNAAYNGARSYLKIITINWFLIALTFNLGYMYRETGNGKIPLIWGIFTLLISIIINCILLYGFHTGVAGAAWGTVGGRVVALFIGIFFLYRKKIQFAFKPWTIFQISGRTWIIFWKRWYMFVGFVGLFVFVTSRYYFWDLAYPIKENSTLGKGIGAMTVLGIAGAISKIFYTVFSSLGAMAAVFIGSELGKGNLKQAKKNSDEIRGYATLMSIVLGILLVIFASALPKMTLFSENNTYMDSAAHLSQAKNVMYVIAFWYPIQVWIMCTYRNASSGGKSFWFAFLNFVTSGVFELGSLAVVTFVIIPYVPFFQDNMWVAYLTFLVVDILELILMEILYHKINWLKNLKSNPII